MLVFTCSKHKSVLKETEKPAAADEHGQIPAANVQ